MPTKQKSGLYRARVRLKDGKYKYLSAKTKQELEAKKAAVLRDSQLGTYADDEHITVGMWANKWLELYKSNKEYKTYEGYRSVVNKHLESIAGIRLKDLRASDVQACINAQNGHWDTQRKIKLAIGQMLEVAIDDGLLYRNVSRQAKVPTKPARETRGLSDAERKAIKECEFTPKEKAFVYLLMYTGMRPGEVRALTINDIDLKHETINVSKALSFKSNEGYIKEPKTKSGIRVVSILEPLKPILSDYLTQVDNLYLFTSSQGHMLTQTTYRRFWKKIYDKINYKMGGTDELQATDITPYCFRHEYATMLYYSGIDIKEAARLMGHTDTRMILDVYSHLDAKRSDSTSKLNEFLKASNDNF